MKNTNQKGFTMKTISDYSKELFDAIKPEEKQNFIEYFNNEYFAKLTADATFQDILNLFSNAYDTIKDELKYATAETCMFNFMCQYYAEDAGMNDRFKSITGTDDHLDFCNRVLF